MATADIAPAGQQDGRDCSVSEVSLSVIFGDSVMVWATMPLDQDTLATCNLRLEPDKPAVIGRADGHEVEYLDPAFRPTPLIPGTGQTILSSHGYGKDNRVSRAHFMLRAASGGVLLVNGVPRRGGGIRPPKNGTKLLKPVKRALGDGEEYLIERGVETVIRLPNGSEIQIDAQ